MTDALTAILDSVRMTGSIFSRASLAAPWGVESGEQDRGIFHAVVRGRAYVWLVEDHEPVVLERGDIVFMPFGDNHVMADEPDRPTRLLGVLNRVDDRGMGHLVVEGDGPKTSLLCGAVTFDRAATHPVFSMLPPLIRVRDVDGSLSPVVEQLIALIAAEVDEDAPGADAVVARLTDVLVIYVLRDYVDRLSDGTGGWLAGLRDPELRKALGLIHARPQEPWTVDQLAHAVGLSRSAFFGRFKALVGETPSQYLTRWRMQVAGRMLREEQATVSSTARRVGYATDAAFSNAFRRVTGMRPGAYRRAA